MKSLTPVFLSILCVLSSVTAVPDHDVLEPMSDDDWPGLEHRKHKRDVHQAVTLQQSEHFVWGSQNNTGTYANMTLNTKDEELVISMERFASELRSVTCGDNLVMTFTSNETYTHVINEWEWVNFHESRTFILIENYAGCGTQSSRQPWVVSNAQYDNAHQTVHLNATKKTWQEVAHTYSMDFGKYTAAASASNETKRGLAGMPDVSASGTKTFSIPLAKTLPSTLFKSTTYESLTFGVDCNTCGTKGTLEVTGHVESSIKNGLTTFSVSAVPKSVSANLALKLSAKGSLGKTWTQQATFLTVAVPGFSIPQVLTVGPNLRFDGGMTVSKVTGSAEISSGITATVPDSSTASVDFVSKAVDVKGWVPTFSVQPVTFGAQVDAEVSLYLQVAVALSLNCLGTGFSVDLDLKIPEVDIKAEAKYDSKKAVCPNATKNGGVSINTSAGAAMTFEAYSMIASKKSVLVNKPVFNSPKAFTAPSVCLPFDGPGDAGAAPAKGGKAKRYEGASAPGRRQY